jgi:serine/threonine protein kinase
MQGIPPAALSKVNSQSLRDFVTLCINPNPKKRPSALDLLKHEFFDSLKLGEHSATKAVAGGVQMLCRCIVQACVVRA